MAEIGFPDSLVSKVWGDALRYSQRLILGTQRKKRAVLQITVRLCVQNPDSFKLRRNGQAPSISKAFFIWKHRYHPTVSDTLLFVKFPQVLDSFNTSSWKKNDREFFSRNMDSVGNNNFLVSLEPRQFDVFLITKCKTKFSQLFL